MQLYDKIYGTQPANPERVTAMIESQRNIFRLNCQRDLKIAIIQKYDIICKKKQQPVQKHLTICTCVSVH
mgnify:CR=1 FL=1